MIEKPKCDNKYVSYLDIVSQLDINKDDIILVSSDILKLLIVSRKNNEHFDSEKFIDTIIEKIGNTGTLLFPTYNWDFCKGKVFDYCNSKSQAGSLSNIALKRKDFIRTKHPIYSHAVWGLDSQYLFNIDNKSAFGPDSVFNYLYENKAKQLFIGPKESFWYIKAYTSIHYIEEKIGVKYRYIKNFAAPYINEIGQKKNKTYNMYVRDLDYKDSFNNQLTTQVSPIITDLLIENNYYKMNLINENYFVSIDMFGIGNILYNSIKGDGKYINFVNSN